MASSNQKKGKQGKGDRFIKQMGLFSGDVDSGEDGDDMDFEAELKRLEANEQSTKKKKSKGGGVLDLKSIEKMASNIDNFDVDSDGESDGSVKEEDLMKELEEITAASSSEEEEEEAPAEVDVVSTLQSRLQMYHSALPTVEAGPKKRRYERAVKTLEGQLKYAKAGKVVDVSEIPPAISVASEVKPKASTATGGVAPAAGGVAAGGVAPAAVASQSVGSVKPPQSASSAPTVTAPPAPIVSVPHATPASTTSAQASAAEPQDPRLKMLTERRGEYQKALVQAKHEGNTALARRFLSIRKNFDHVISAISDGQEVDLSNIPPPPNMASTAKNSPSAAASSKPEEAVLPDVAPPTKEEAKSLFHTPDSAPTDTMDALQQRLKRYQESEQEAKESNNGGKARRMGRIVKQYQDAMKACKAGKPFDYSELPSPPGFAEIPLPGKATLSAAQPQSPPQPTAQHSQRSAQPPAQPPAQPATQAAAKPQVAQPTQPSTVKKTQPAQQSMKSPPKRQASLSIQGKQLAVLQERQLEYKRAALEAKTHDNRELALKYLRVAKGMDAMVHAATNGLPVDMSQVPPEPATSHKVGSILVEASELSELSPEERVTEFEKIVNQLKEQMKTSGETAVRFKALGDIKNAFVFENLQQSAKKDVDAVQNAFRNNDPPPKYHYETKKYSIVRVNTELGDGDLLINIVKGLHFQLPSELSSPKDLDTQIYFEFPWPQEDPQKGRTEWCRHTDNPVYNFTTKLKIDRRSKSMQRLFKSRKLKLELYYRRGFLKSDRHFSTVFIKLDKLETLSAVHESFDLLDTNGRKEIGGNLEVILKMREPLSQKQVEMVEEKWLTIDQFVRLNKPVIQESPTATAGSSRSRGKQISLGDTTSPVSSLPLQSLEVLKFEKGELDARIRQYSASKQLSSADLNKLTQKSSEMASQMDVITGMMRSNQLSARDYLNILSQLNKNYTEFIQSAAKTGDKRRHQLLNRKKDIITREIRVWQTKVKSNK